MTDPLLSPPNQEMLNSIILSIKPYYMEKIVIKQKLYEFRNFKPVHFTSYFWVYESTNTKELKYIMKIKTPIIHPTVIDCSSYGVDRFNSGKMKNQYAYEIEELYIFENPLSLEFLRKHFNFTAPQAYTYLNNNKELQHFIAVNTRLIQLI